jgi:hypothetical protein
MFRRFLQAIAKFLQTAVGINRWPNRIGGQLGGHLKGRDPVSSRPTRFGRYPDCSAMARVAAVRIRALTLGYVLIVGGAQAEGRSIVVVELFTSQGCSSCPPAEEVLLDLAENPNVLALAFHVDYWDRLGWPDPYSSREATRRQYDYAGHFGESTVYTPQIVVGGRRGMVGSYRAEVLAAIDADLADSDTTVSLSVRREGGALDIGIGAGRGRGQLLLVGFDPRIVTKVRRGENAGRSIVQANVVRSVETVAEWDGSALNLSQPVPLGERTALILQAQDGRIIGAALVTK